MDSILKLLGEIGLPPDWRGAVLLLIVALTVYFVVSVLRLLKLPRPFSRDYAMYAPEVKSVPPEFDAPPGSVLAGVWPGPSEPSLRDEPETPPVAPAAAPHQPSLLERAVDQAMGRRPAAPVLISAPAPASAAPVPDDFAGQLGQKSLEQQLWQLREQLNGARAEITRLSSEIQQLQAVHVVSPLYHEATSMALRGVDAAGVAGRCGISIAEAELVVALSRKPEARAAREAAQAEGNPATGADYDSYEEEHDHDRDASYRTGR